MVVWWRRSQTQGWTQWEVVISEHVWALVSQLPSGTDDVAVSCQWSITYFILKQCSDDHPNGQLQGSHIDQQISQTSGSGRSQCSTFKRSLVTARSRESCLLSTPITMTIAARRYSIPFWKATVQWTTALSVSDASRAQKRSEKCLVAYTPLWEAFPAHLLCTALTMIGTRFNYGAQHMRTKTSGSRSVGQDLVTSHELFALLLSHLRCYST